MNYLQRRFDVVGEDDDDVMDVYPGVQGDVMGYDVMGAGKKGMRMRKPAWRQGQVAPGVQLPDEGLVSLPLNGTTGTNTFALAQQSITFAGQLQKPFRGERLLVSVVRTGATAIGRLLGQIFVGTDLQQADITALDLEQIGQANAFGVRLAMKPAQPGVLIQIPTRLSNAIAGTDTILATVQLLGRIVY